MKPTLRLCLILVLMLTLTSCSGGGGGDSDTTPAVPESQTVGPSGGTLTFASGAIVMTVSAGAVPSNTTITIQRSTSAPGSSTMISSLAYDFGPEGTMFSAPVYLTIHYNPSEIPAGISESDLRLCKVSGGAWAGLTVSSVDTVAHTVTGLLTGFSTYGVGSAPLTPLVPPAVPTVPAASGFDNVVNDPAVTGDAIQIAIGTAGKNRITQYGGTGTVTQSANGNAADDWVLQVCSGVSCSQSATAGAGNDTVYQFVTGGGAGFQGIIGVAGTPGDYQTYIQVGGQGVNLISVDASSTINNSVHIEQYGGPVGNTMEAYGSNGDDLVAMYGGAGNDTLIYDMSNGNDTVIINGGAGTDTLTINTGGLLNYKIKDSNGNILFSSGTGGTVITVANVETITVLDQNGKPLFIWGAPLLAPAVPSIPDASGFDNVVSNPAVTGDATQIADGTIGKDLITQYGGTGTVTQIVNANAGDDWILQQCGGMSCAQSVTAGNGNDTVYQFVTGSGASTQTAEGGTVGLQTFIQVGGQGVNAMTVDDSGNGGSAHIEMYGGPAGNTMEATGSKGNDVVAIYGGIGNDTIIYDLTSGNDVVVINGGGGTDTLTVNTQGELNYKIKDSNGTMLFTSGTGGTVITFANMETITVLDQNSNVVFTWP